MDGHTNRYSPNVGLSHFYLCYLQPDLCKIGHEGGPLDLNDRKNTVVKLPWQQLPW